MHKKLPEFYAVNQIQQENHLILNQIYEILAELNNQNKQVILWKVPAHIELKEIKKQVKQQNKQ